MKDIQELALGTIDVQAITPTLIASGIMEVARGEVVFAQFFRPNRDLVGLGKPHELSFPKKGTGITTSWGISPGGTVTASSMTYDATTIRVSKGGIRLEFTNESLEAAMRDVIKDHIYDAGLEWAEQIDGVAKTVMLSLVAATGTLTGAVAVSGVTVTSTLKPILSITANVGNTIDYVDYYDGVVWYKSTMPAATVSFLYASRPNSNTMTVEVQGQQTISPWDMWQTKNKIIAQKRHPDFFIMNDLDLPGFIYDQNLKFLDTSAYGSREAIMNGEVGKVLALRIVTSVLAPEGAGIVIDSSRMGYDVHKRDLRGYREDKYEYDSVWYHFWSERGFGVADDLALALVVGGYASTDYRATVS